MKPDRVMNEKRLVNDFTTKKDPGIYHYIRSLSSKPPFLPEVHFNSNKADSPLSIANLFNQLFHSVFNTSSSSSIDPPLSFPEISICNIDISVQNIFDVLTSIQLDKAMGGNGIPPIILKEAATATLEPLYSTSFNYVSNTPLFPRNAVITT